MNHKETARKLFLEGYNCAQSVYGAFCDVTGMDFSTAMLLSSSFGGGMGRMREVCGACSGMFMAAGLLYGYDQSDDYAGKAAHYALIQQMAEEFKARNRTIICRDLLRDLKPSENAVPTVRDDTFYKERPCLKFVEDAAEILDRLIEAKGKVQ